MDWTQLDTDDTPPTGNLYTDPPSYVEVKQNSAEVSAAVRGIGGWLVARPGGWDVLGLDGDPTPGVVESGQALAKEFGDFSHDVQHAWSSLNSFGGDATALSWVGQTADAFKASFGPLPGRLQKLYVSYGEASDALSAYWPKMQTAQSKADAALRQGQDAEADVSRATGTANNAAADLKTGVTPGK